MAAQAAPEPNPIGQAMKELVGRRGYNGLTVAELTEAAGVETAAFSARYTSLDECFMEVWEETDAELAEKMRAAYEAEDGEWPRRLRVTLDALLTFLDSDPARARLYIAEVHHVSEELRARREQAQARLASYIDRGRNGDSAPEHAAEAVAGAIWYRLEARMRRQEDGPMRQELPLMTYFAVLPYRGSEIAEAELRRTVPEG